MHMHAVALFNISAAMLAAQGVSPRIWLGWEDRKHTTVATQMNQLSTVCFQRVIKHLDMVSLGLSAAGSWVWENANDYWEAYGPQTNISVGFFLPIPSWLYRM